MCSKLRQQLKQFYAKEYYLKTIKAGEKEKKIKKENQEID